MSSQISGSIRRFTAAAIVSLLVAIPAVARAGDDAAELERTRQEIAAIRKRLAGQKGQAAAIQRDVDALQKKIDALNRQISAGERDISELESEIRSSEAKILELEEKYRLAQQASNQRARRIYKAGPSDTVSRLLTARSITEFARLVVWWGVAAELDGRTMLDATRLKADLAERKQDLDRSREDLASRKKGLLERRELIASARSERALALGAVQAQIRAEEGNIAQLERESRELTARLKAAQLSRSATGEVSTAGFIWPLNGRISSGYGPRGGGFHPGIDIEGPTGAPIVAAKAGTIVGVACGSGYGICTIIDHGDGVTTLYAHMSRKGPSGGSVDRGDVIGYVGCTGSCTGPHLHFEVRVNGETRNPRNFLP